MEWGLQTFEEPSIVKHCAFLHGSIRSNEAACFVGRITVKQIVFSVESAVQHAVRLHEECKNVIIDLSNRLLYSKDSA